MARRKTSTTADAPVKRTGLTSAVRYDGTGLPPRGSGAGRLTSAPLASAAPADDAPDSGAVDHAAPTGTEPVASTVEATDTTLPEEG